MPLNCNSGFNHLQVWFEDKYERNYDLTCYNAKQTCILTVFQNLLVVTRALHG